MTDQETVISLTSGDQRTIKEFFFCAVQTDVAVHRKVFLPVQEDSGGAYR